MQFLRSQLSITNCLHTLVLAAQYDCHDLFEDAVCLFPRRRDKSCLLSTLFVVVHAFLLCWTALI